MMLTHDSLAYTKETEAWNNASGTPSALQLDQKSVYDDYDPHSFAIGTKVFRNRPSRSDVPQEPGSNIHWLRRPVPAILLDPNGSRQLAKAALLWGGVRAALVAWSALRDDWDGDDAVAPVASQLRAAERFVAGSEAHCVREPRTYVTADGEIGFHWDGATKATVSFLPSDRFLVFCPREGDEPLRIAGPLDIAACSAEMFKSLAALR